MADFFNGYQIHGVENSTEEMNEQKLLIGCQPVSQSASQPVSQSASQLVS
jgi:hypothetical protein